MKIYAAIEAGGTKFNCAVFNEHREFLDFTRIPTTTPSETLSAVIKFFSLYRQRHADFKALGVASFGPLDLNQLSSTYGYITRTPKQHWSNTDIVGPLQEALNCPTGFDTDVNGTGLAEASWGAGVDCDCVIYLTVGTGIGGGVIINGKPLHGLIHPEIGHMLVPGLSDENGFCPFHERCAEGLASGTSMAKMWDASAQTLTPEHPAWARQAGILAQICHNLLVCFSPQKIVIGGGVMAQPQLLDNVVKATAASLKNYLTLPSHYSLSEIIVRPTLGEFSGLFGAFALAKNATHI